MTRATHPLRARSLPRGRELLRPIGLLAAALAVDQGYLTLARQLSPLGALVGALLVPVALFLLFLGWTLWDRRPLSAYGFLLPRSLLGSLAFAGLLVGVQAVVLLEPGFGLGFSPVAALSPAAFAATVALALMGALAYVAILDGYLLQRLLAPGRLAAGLGISSAGWALLLTNFSILGSLGRVELGTYLLTTTATGFVTGLAAGLYFYKAGRNLLGPFVWRAGGLLVAGLLPIAALTTGWELSFLTTILADGVVLMLVLTVLREPKLVARAYLGETYGAKRDRFLGTMRQRRRAREIALTVAVTAALALTAVVGVEAGLGTPRPFIAIESGSMTPTFVRGTLVVLEHASPAQIHIGTIIAYTTTCLPSPVVHRVVAVTQGSSGPIYTTKGDANPSDDPCPVPYASVVGRVVAIVPYAGWFILAPEVTAGLGVLIALAAWLVRPASSPRFPRRRVAA
jgi:signal peptidase I